MARSAPYSLLTALGFSPAIDRLYQRLLAQPRREVASIANSLNATPEALFAEMQPLLDVGIVRVQDDRVLVAGPVEALGVVLAQQAEVAASVRRELELVTTALPFLAVGAMKPAPGEVEGVIPLDGEISSGGKPVQLLADLMLRGKGDLLWWRPDQWRLPREDRMAELVRQVTATGRRSRAIYPLRVLQEAPSALQHRAEAGEEIRLVPDLPTRMVVIAPTHVILPEPLGNADEPRTLTRQRGLVELATLAFELMWERASPVPPDLDRRAEARPDLRRFLLQQMAAGLQDEQIARSLGVSLRTVRRRIATIMTEVGADTRFQAGVEAARHGWI